jgi:nucleoside-diphosphate-sugar epimerase
MVDLYTSGITYDNRKAKEILGFESRLSFQQTMERVGAWLRYQRLA